MLCGGPIEASAFAIGHFGALTLKGQHLTGLDHDAELQHQLRGALQEGLKQTQHADIGALEHHAPVVVSALGVSVPAALHAQIQGVDIPVYQRQNTIQTRLISALKFCWKKASRILGLNTKLQKLLDIKHRLSEVITHYSKLWELSVVLAKKLVECSFRI